MPLIMSPLAKDLFHKAIGQSFNMLNSPIPALADKVKANASLVIKGKNDNSPDPQPTATAIPDEPFGGLSLDQMRALPVDKLLKVNFASSFVIDGHVLPKDTRDTLASGTQNDVSHAQRHGHRRYGHVSRPVYRPAP